MPTPLRRRETLVHHPSRPPLTQSEYYTALERLAPGCDPLELDAQLTTFIKQFIRELSTRDVIDKEDHTHLALARVLWADGCNSLNNPIQLDPRNIDRVVPKWVFDPDERRNKLQHLRCYKLRVVIPEDDSCWARACRSVSGLEILLSKGRSNPKSFTTQATRDACSTLNAK
ncbi:unnamed protein product [Rhizoctonia solani]|uniref:Uncharacterized protein n=1 Tax=Rhizoctonia solani TaxID=456999 RepID=A0A8H3C864_9AGAM|nr:unnamed protein product [Rhizoctonia solani]